MKLLICSFFLVFILAVNGQDPTAICYPPIFQTAYFNLLTEDKGSISVDFNKQKYVEISSVSGYRYIHDFANLKSYAIMGEGNFTTCKAYNLQQSQIMYKCLPPYAKLVSPATGYLHHVTAARMYMQTWDIETESDMISRVSFSVVGGQPYWPIMSQEYGYHGTTNVYLYLNPTPAVANQTIFTIPTVCTEHTINTRPIIG
uniref:Uncharacterized protein n=1 Tax=Arion vulgaris TaxID=1028688 RepID=A0A0B7A5N0_9EUPU